MSDPSNPSSTAGSLPLHALPDGDAALHVVLTLRWDDIAALGREAGRLAATLRRPVSLDEAASHRLSTRSITPAPPANTALTSSAGEARSESRGPFDPPARISSVTGRTPDPTRATG
ncbi:hypothetical protein NGB36_02640 [Streptomyces sp. RB6PN25]|uniref:Uncharacterized protein n=1 Tax=Streptomyces humicola TaxID=2953240 RepID=A0ABT1PPC2_9ACTN|nr:hypothetical protein [Streptomyces humicola]MCQ4079524.1 hypothetical protein [Streptomyces humicola]